MKIFVLLGILLISLASCGQKQESDPWPYVLVELEQDNGIGDTFKLPVRFDPAAGEYAAVCGETEHGEDCPFWSERYYDANFTVWRDILFWARRHDDGYTVCTYNMTTGEEQTVTECGSPGSFRIVGDYLYIGNSLTQTERICLTDGTAVEDPVGKRPDWVDGSTAYYRIEGARGRDGGIYRQDLYEKDSIWTPLKELLFADAVVYDCWYDGDVIFWEGNETIYSMDGDGTHLYRYDLHTRKNTMLKVNFEEGICVSEGNWLYTVSDNALLKIHKETGETKTVYETAELKLTSGYRLKEADGYIVLPAFADGKVGMLVYHPGTGETVFRVILE